MPLALEMTRFRPQYYLLQEHAAEARNAAKNRSYTPISRHGHGKVPPEDEEIK